MAIVVEFVDETTRLWSLSVLLLFAWFSFQRHFRSPFVRFWWRNAVSKGYQARIDSERWKQWS